MRSNLAAALCLPVALIAVSALAQPANDACGNAAVVGNGFTQVDTTDATTDGPSEPGCNFASNPLIQNDVWYRYTATCNGTASVDFCSANFDTRIAVYHAACPAGPGTAFAC